MGNKMQALKNTMASSGKSKNILPAYFLKHEILISKFETNPKFKYLMLKTLLPIDGSQQSMFYTCIFGIVSRPYITINHKSIADGLCFTACLSGKDVLLLNFTQLF
jgi:hypothetical protein